MLKSKWKERHIISPAALKLLSAAYENYNKTQNTHFSSKNGNDLFYTITGIRQLYEDGYINNVPDFVFQNSINLFVPISFDITESGIEYMRTNRKL